MNVFNNFGYKLFSGESSLDYMPEVLKWLNDKGINSLSSRYSKYSRDIDDYFKCADPTSIEGRAKFDKLTNSYLECINIVTVYKVFRDEHSKGFVDRLKQVISGQQHPGNGSAGPSRDFLFELMIAARLQQSGFKIDFNKLTDVVADNGEFLVFGECKRLSSEKKFEANFKHAGKRLDLRAKKETKRVHGIIFVNVSSCLTNIPQSELLDEIEAWRVISSSVEQFVVRNNNKIEQLNERFSNTSLGVCLIGQAPVWTKNFTLYSVTNTRVIAPVSLSDTDFKSLNKILDNFTCSMFSLF